MHEKAVFVVGEFDTRSVLLHRDLEEFTDVLDSFDQLHVVQLGDWNCENQLIVQLVVVGDFHMAFVVDSVANLFDVTLNQGIHRFSPVKVLDCHELVAEIVRITRYLS